MEPGERQARRSERHRLKRAQRAFTASRSSRLCWTAAALGVVVDVGRELVAHVSQVHRCGSPWACPVCAPVVRERRAQEIDAGLGRHLVDGGGAEFVTLTVRHHRGDSLAGRLDVVGQALGLVLSGSPWARRRERLGFVGAIRTTEITWGERNGWHPHCHALLLFDRPLTGEEREDLRAWLLGRWGGICERRGFGTLNGHGVDVRAVGTPGELSGYLTKVEGGWSAGAEISRTDLKGHAPIALLRSFVETGEKRWLWLWREYEEATFGKRAIVWSPGLRARLLGVEEETADVDLAAAEGGDLAVLRWLVERDRWHRELSAGTTGDLLSDLERTTGVLVLLADVLGVELHPVGLPREERIPLRT